MEFDAVELERGKQSAGRVVPFLLVIAVCLLAGIALGSWTGGRTASPADPKQAPLAVVYLGYADFLSPARLRGVWILTLDGDGRAEFAGVSPALVVTTTLGQAAVLRDFLSDPSGAPSRVPQIPVFPPSARIVLIDEQGLLTYVNRTGGVPIEGRYLNGPDLLAFLAQGESDPLAVLRRQLRVVRSMFSAGPCPGESALAGLDPEHYLSELAPELLVAECRRRGPYLQGAVTFRIMEDVIPWQLPDGSIGLLPSA
ncbi:MAG: hypothetical protein JW929_00910 [Anaerolineales bacterium]|nr:hypothetical protein [Anaerolineales bacterium]